MDGCLPTADQKELTAKMERLARGRNIYPEKSENTKTTHLNSTKPTIYLQQLLPAS
jgi:hypothetical protein